MDNLIWSTEEIENETDEELVDDHIILLGRLLSRKFYDGSSIKVDGYSNGYKEVYLSQGEYWVGKELLLPEYENESNCRIDLFEDDRERYYVMYYSSDITNGERWDLSSVLV